MSCSENYKHTAITEQIIKAYYKVYNALGYGFLEKVYENALLVELLSMGMLVEKKNYKSLLWRKPGWEILCRFID